MNTKAREGDFVEDKSGAIFDVKGLVHPPERVVAYLRYVVSKKGERKRCGRAYSKIYSLSKRYAFLKERLPQYLVYDPVFDETICEIPLNRIRRRFDPVSRLKELGHERKTSMLECKAVQLAELLKTRARISWQDLGISGSLLVKLHTLKSDIDLVVYGSDSCTKTYAALRRFLNDECSPFKCYSQEDLKDLFEFRSKDTVTDFGSFVRTESRKTIQGKFMGTDYFCRFVKGWNEIEENYGDVQYRNVGTAKLQATVTDDSEAIFTPCVYKIDKVQALEGSKAGPIEKIVSFRGRFCEQARTGERVVAQGKVERVIDTRHANQHFRILLGNKTSDFMSRLDIRSGKQPS